MTIKLTAAELREVFGDHDPTQFEEEAQQRWGDTGAYAESRRRTSSYTKADWTRHAAESEDIELAFLAAMQEGLSAESVDAKRTAERHRVLIDTWFYPCS